MVNIAVFATFHIVIESILRVKAGFKPVCRLSQLDTWRYGWQKWQDRGKKWQRGGTVGDKNGKVRWTCGSIHGITRAVAGGCGRRVRRGMRLFKVLAARDGAAVIELKYHEPSGMSRW